MEMEHVCYFLQIEWIDVVCIKKMHHSKKLGVTPCQY